MSGGSRCLGGLLTLAALTTISSAQNQPSVWDLNGSQMYLSANGAQREIRYNTVRPGLEEAGVQPGTVWFQGTRAGYQYSGTAYVFSKPCGAVPYSVTGTVSADDRTITIHGRSPRVTPNTCTITSYSDTTDILRLIENENMSVSKLICIHPVFTTEYELMQAINGSSSRTQRIAAAINYLHLKYCREVTGPVAQAITADQDRQVGDACHQYSGVFRGERVYWGSCAE